MVTASRVRSHVHTIAVHERAAINESVRCVRERELAYATIDLRSWLDHSITGITIARKPSPSIITGAVGLSVVHSVMSSRRIASMR